MVLALEIAFWTSVALLLYGYAGYPLLALAAGKLLGRRVRREGVTPSVSVVIAAFDEEKGIRRRLENVCGSDYPGERLEVLVASDGSTDATEEIVSSFPDDRVRLLRLPRRGKAHALNEAVQRARGDVLVFSDANTEFEPDALRKLVRSLADPEVGGVVGHTLYRRNGRERNGREAESSGRGEALYWRYDTWLKALESRTGSVVSAHGGMYAVRRELFSPLTDMAVTDDFAVSTGVVRAGRRLVFEPAARAWEAPVEKSGRELSRRVRLMTRGLRGVLLRRRLLDVREHGFYSVALFSRKVLRRLLPLVLPVVFVASVALWSQGLVYRAAVLAQGLFYALAAAGWALRGRPLGHRKVFYVPFFYCLANLASAMAVVNVARGRRIERWSPQRHDPDPGREDEAEPTGDSEQRVRPEPEQRVRPESEQRVRPESERRVRPEPVREPAADPAVVIGLDCATGLQTARILAERGVPVYGVASDPHHPCCRTRVCEEIVVAGTSGRELLDALHELAVRLPGRAVLFPCTDLAVLEVARHRRDLPPSLRVVLPEVEVLETLLDKARFLELARREGHPVPDGRVLRSRADAVTASRSLRFPCAVKPPVKTAAWEARTSAKVFRAEAPADLPDLYEAYAEAAGGTLVVQEWVEGPDTEHFTCNAYLDRSGRVDATFTTRKLRQWPLVGGQASLGQEWRDDDVRDATIRLFRAVGLRGMGYLEMKRDARTGRLVILEANVGRPTGRSATAEAAGVEYLMTAYRDALEQDLPRERVQRYRGVKWIHLRHDLQAALALWRQGRLDAREWLSSLRGPRTYALLSWTDPLPFAADLARAGRKLLDRAVRKLLARPGRKLLDRAVRKDRERAGRKPGDGVAGDPDRIAAPDVADFHPDVVDFQVVPRATLRLVDPSPADVRAVEAIVGPAGRPRRGSPRILVRFVEELPSSGLRVLQDGETAFDDDGLYLLRSRAAGPEARLTAGDDEPWIELVCIRGSGRVPLLASLVDLVALEAGWAPLHASAWIRDGIGVVAAGWDRSGKTGALLAFLEQGARFVGDDRVLVHRTGQRMRGFLRPVTVRDWHVHGVPELGPTVGPLRSSMAAAGVWLDGVQGAGAGGGPLSARLVSKCAGRLRRRLSTRIDPGELFGGRDAPGRGRPRVFFLLQTHDSPEMRVEPADPSELAARLAATVAAELAPLARVSRALRFAFPERRWSAVDRVAERAEEILGDALAGTTARVVRHPYPCSLVELRETMEDALIPVTASRIQPFMERRRNGRPHPSAADGPAPSTADSRTRPPVDLAPMGDPAPEADSSDVSPRSR